ncbi:MAG: hypothetical protein FVQ83_15955 [Chloroflexi bacterium]|nr:hypothetical protein [Chloroflexota bacterium]
MHSALKSFFAQPGDELEAEVDGYIVDVKRVDLLIEIQTRNFSAIKNKLEELCKRHPVQLVYPITQVKWIIRVDKTGKTIKKRKSPKRGRIEHLFNEMIHIPELTNNPNFSLKVLLIKAEEIWIDDGKGSWRRKGWSIRDQNLIEIIEEIKFDSIHDYLDLLPSSLPMEFTNKDLRQISKLPIRLVGKMTYCLRKIGILKIIAKRGNAYVFMRV